MPGQRHVYAVPASLRLNHWSPGSGCISSSGSTAPVNDHTFEIGFLDPGVQAYVFTFG